MLEKQTAFSPLGTAVNSSWCVCLHYVYLHGPGTTYSIISCHLSAVLLHPCVYL